MASETGDSGVDIDDIKAVFDDEDDFDSPGRMLLLYLKLMYCHWSWAASEIILLEYYCNHKDYSDRMFE